MTKYRPGEKNVCDYCGGFDGDHDDGCEREE